MTNKTIKYLESSNHKDFIMRLEYSDKLHCMDVKPSGISLLDCLQTYKFRHVVVCKTCLWFMCLHLVWTSYIQWPWDQRAKRHLHADAFVLHIFSNAIKQYFQYGLRVQILFMHVHLPLWDMPTARHLWKRQYWHLFLFFFWILHFRAHLSYSSLSRMVLLKNPCEIYIYEIFIY